MGFQIDAMASESFYSIFWERNLASIILKTFPTHNFETSDEIYFSVSWGMLEKISPNAWKPDNIY